MASDLIDPDLLTLPLSAELPSGRDLEYEPAFAELEQSGAGKPERQYGDTVYPAEAPDWPTVHEQALSLAQTTRDLRVAVWLMRSSCRMHGLQGAAAGLRLVSGMLLQLWDSVHPQLDASDNNDPTMRLNALAPLSAQEAGLADLRSVALAPVRNSLTLRQLELGLGKAEPLADETVPTEAGALQALRELLQAHPDIEQRAADAVAAVQSMSGWLDQQLGYSHSVDLGPALKLLAVLGVAIKTVKPKPAEVESEAEQGGDGAAAVAGASGPAARSAAGSINSRADAVRELQRICDWMERNEPANPAPILLRRAQRLMNMSFMDIMRNLAPDGLSQVQNLAGPEEDGR